MAGNCGYGEELSGSINAGNFLTSGKVYWLASQEGLCSMEQVSKYYSGDKMITTRPYPEPGASNAQRKIQFYAILLSMFRSP